MTANPPFALVIGAGPAGLMAADELLRSGTPVIIAEAKPSPARKLLMAGKSGLNVTKDEAPDAFLSHFAEASEWLRPMLTEFGPEQIVDWMTQHGQKAFTGSSGRVFPVSMKASPLLRAWLTDLAQRGLDLRTRWRWVGYRDGVFSFETPDGPQTLRPHTTVLALGGASWSRLGSDGAWATILAQEGVQLSAFKPANMGFVANWSLHMATHFGAPLKSVVLCAGDQRVRAEAVISERGIEGGGIYAVSRALREGAALTIDLFPDTSVQALTAKLSGRPKGETATNTMRKALKLAGVRLALVLECARPLPTDPQARAQVLKSLPIPLTGPRPIDEAISTAGGIAHSAVTDALMLRELPGVFAAGEMLDWEAPTGGYLLTACLATGRWAGQAAAAWSGDHTRHDKPTTP